MLWLIDLTASSEATPGTNSWACGVLQGIQDLNVSDRWVVVGTLALPESIHRAAAHSGVEVAVVARHRAVVQQIELPRLARRIHADGLLAATTVLPLQRRGVPAVSVLMDLRHREEPERYSRMQLRYRNVMYRHAIRRADRLVSISHSTALAALREDATCGSRMLVAHPGADHVDSWPQVPRHDYAIAFAQWPNKEPRVAISAWARAMRGIKDPPMIYVVGVPSRERASLEAHVVAEHASAVVCLRGRLDEDEFRALFASSALLLFPSSAEGLGLPVLEAMRLGLSVVASDLMSIKEVGGAHAWYANPGDVDGFAAAIRDALAQDPERIEAGRRHAGTFTWGRCAEAIRLSLTLAARG